MTSKPGSRGAGVFKISLKGAGDTNIAGPVEFERAMKLQII